MIEIILIHALVATYNLTGVARNTTKGSRRLCFINREEGVGNTMYYVGNTIIALMCCTPIISHYILIKLMLFKQVK